VPIRFGAPGRFLISRVGLPNMGGIRHEVPITVRVLVAEVVDVLVLQHGRVGIDLADVLSCRVNVTVARDVLQRRAARPPTDHPAPRLTWFKPAGRCRAVRKLSKAAATLPQPPVHYERGVLAPFRQRRQRRWGRRTVSRLTRCWSWAWIHRLTADVTVLVGVA